jgi:hypothetical protein
MNSIWHEMMQCGNKVKHYGYISTSKLKAAFVREMPAHGTIRDRRTVHGQVFGEKINSAIVIQSWASLLNLSTRLHGVTSRVLIFNAVRT